MNTQIISDSTPVSDKPIRVALVAGGSRGIGFAICHDLADAGYHVIAAARTQDELQELSDSFATKGREITCLNFDMANAESINTMVKTAHQCHGQLDVVINSAGISYVAPVALANLDRCEEVLQVNLMGAFTLSKAAVRIMTRQRYGRIVHIGSISGTIGAAYNAIYAASKAGVAGLVKSLALEVASLGITVNAVQPGTVHTRLFEQTHGARAKLKGITIEEQKALMEADNPQKKLVTVNDVAAAVCFLVSDGAGSINGHLLNVDGGRSIS
jgi:NAD(P)-dependent dehydrogenase (short-subunit alcohol dehydrogenase family)